MEISNIQIKAFVWESQLFNIYQHTDCLLPKFPSGSLSFAPAPKQASKQASKRVKGWGTLEPCTRRECLEPGRGAWCHNQLPGIKWS
jgi:hypothetical protein